MKKINSYSYIFFTVLLLTVCIQIIILALSSNNLEKLGDPFIFISFSSITHTPWLFITSMVSLVTGAIINGLHWKE